MSWLLAHAWWALFALVAASWLAVPAFLLADGIRSALRTWRAGRADAFEPDAPPLAPDALAALDQQFDHLPPDYFQRLRALYLTPERH